MPMISTFAEAVSVRTMFEQREIEAFHKKVGSWDLVIATCGYAQVWGLGNLMYAYSKMRESYPDESAQELYKMFGIM
jgi:hypothetical protein